MIRMMLCWTCLMVAFCCVGQEGISQPERFAPSIADSIPFSLTSHNNIAVSCLLNEVDTVNLMLHTAASGLTLIRECATTLKSIQTDGVDTVNSWGGANTASYSYDNSLRIGQSVFKGLTVWVNEKSGPGTDGKFGLDFFEDQIIELDFEQQLLLVYPELTEADALEKGFMPYNMDAGDGFLLLSGESVFGGKTMTKQFLIHSGYGGSLLFDDETTAEHQLSKHLKVIKETELKDAYGNVLKTKKAILPEFVLAGQTIKEVPVGFFEGAIGRQKVSVLGGELLKRFNIIFDIKNEKAYLKPNALIKTPFADS